MVEMTQVDDIQQHPKNNELPTYEESLKRPEILPQEICAMQNGNKCNNSISIKDFCKLLTIIMVLHACIVLSYLAPLKHFSLRFKIDTPEAKRIMSSVTEGLKMISYIAKDLSVTVNGQKNILDDFAYLDTIDTFTQNYIHEFYVLKYCRYNTISEESNCTAAYGLDVFRGIIYDIGIQLGHVLESNNTSELGKSLVQMYSNTNSALDAIYRENKKHSLGISDSNLAALRIAHSLKLSETYGKFAAFVGITLNVFHGLALVSLGISTLAMAKLDYFNKYYQLRIYAAYRIGVLALTLSFWILLLHWTSEICYYRLMKYFTLKLDIAEFRLEWGFVLLNVCVFLFTMALIQAFIIYFKRNI